MIRKDCSDGYILKVDFKYPKELHDLYNDYLQHPRKLQIKHDMLYNYCEIIGGAKKLAPNLDSNGKYGLDYRNLQLYLSCATILAGIHRVLKFEQSRLVGKIQVDFFQKRLLLADELQCLW